MKRTASLIRKIKERALSENELEELLSSIDFLKEAHKYSNKLEPIPSVHEIRREFEEVKSKLKDFVMVAKWVESMNVQMEAFPEVHDIGGMKLPDLEVILIEFESSLDLEKEVIRTLSFFVNRKSSLFAAVSEQYRRKLNKQALTMKDISEMVKSTSNFLEKLLDVDKMFLSDIDDIHQISIKFKSNFSEELNVA
jgi:hypothetical protein